MNGENEAIKWRFMPEGPQQEEVPAGHHGCRCESIVIHVDYEAGRRLVVASLRNRNMVVCAHGRTVSEALLELGATLHDRDACVHDYYGMPYGR